MSSQPIIVALGGNALAGDDHRQAYPALGPACQAMAPWASGGLLITHGNGPQIGNLAEERDKRMTLDSLGAETEGLLGYRIALELSRVLSPGTSPACILTEVEVDPEDPAFERPEKPIGPWLEKAQAEHMGRQAGWQFTSDNGRYRRVVASPRPRGILQLPAIRALMAAQIVTVCCGGGGIPVTRREAGGFSGVEAVVDKDLTSAQLAVELDARMLVLATNVDAVYRDWQASGSDPVARATPDELARLDFAPGSMGPKVEAACGFAERTGRPAVIGALEDLPALIAGDAGTLIASRGYRHER